MKLIDKDALVAEIKARISDIEVSQKAGLIKKRDADKKMLIFKSILSLIDTLKVKEVELDEEAENYASTDEVLPNGKVMINFQAEKAFKAGAKWQKKQMLGI